ncbi:MAG: flavodoxin family protein [Promethearchaeota archaeon]
MKRALVLYDSHFGNTKAVALALVRGIEATGTETECLNIDEASLQQIPGFDFIAIGGPTHIIRTSKEMKDFLMQLRSIELRGIMGFAFDTRIESRMNQRKWGVFENSAARRIQGAMKRMKMKIIRNRQSALVQGREGPLAPGVENEFEKVGREIGAIIVEATRQSSNGAGIHERK